MMTVTTSRGQRIVVAIDGSEASHSALVWGTKEAAIRGAELHVLHVWQFAFGMAADTVEKFVDTAIDSACDESGVERRSLCIHRESAFGQSIPVILAAADGADLLVVGSHRHSQLGALFLGSVSQCLCVYSTCPVVVVHASPPEERPVESARTALLDEHSVTEPRSTMTDDESVGRLEELDDSECLALLGSKDLGRLAVVREGRPEMFPVNYVVDGITVVFRTDPGTKFDWSVMGPVGFEVEEIDPRTREGWVVEVRGIARDITDGGDPRSESLRSLPLQPWVSGDKSNWIAIVRPKFSGRRLSRH